jgi:hypothetical protein
MCCSRNRHEDELTRDVVSARLLRPQVALHQHLLQGRQVEPAQGRVGVIIIIIIIIVVVIIIRMIINVVIIIPTS